MTHGELIVRSGRIDEISEILDLWDRGGRSASVSDDRQGLQALCSADGESLLVVEKAGRIVGSLIAGWDGWRGNVYRLAVLPEFRREGIARALVTEGERRLRQKGARRLVALVLAADTEAAGFWQSCGYVRDAHGRLVKTFN